MIVAAGSQRASAIARHPEPVPTSAMASRWGACSGPWPAPPDGSTNPRQGLFDERLGLRPRDEDARDDLDLEVPELAVADDAGRRLAALPPDDQRARTRVESRRAAGAQFREQAAALPAAQGVPGEHVRVDRSLVGRDAGALEPPPRVLNAVLERVSLGHCASRTSSQ